MFKMGILLVVIMLPGCATIYTVSHADKGIEISGTYCGDIPHVMSGTFYNICTMYGAPRDKSGINTEDRLVALAIDSVFSIVADVVVFPYTFYNSLTRSRIVVRSGAKFN